MIKKIKSGISNVWEFYRTAPFAESTFVLLSYYVVEAFKDNNLLKGFTISGITLCSVAAVYHQFKLKKRLENHIQEHGFTKGGFEKTIPTWCGRQTARVVAEKHGCLDEYVKLCKQNREVMRDRYIPHF